MAKEDIDKKEITKDGQSIITYGPFILRINKIDKLDLNGNYELSCDQLGIIQRDLNTYTLRQACANAYLICVKEMIIYSDCMLSKALRLQD
jgi:hypothetical protein